MAKKHGNGEGSISRRKNGGWMAQYAVYTAKGRKRKTLYGKTRSDGGREAHQGYGRSGTGVDF